MPMVKKWSDFTLDKVERESQVFGVYEIGDRDKNVLYIGHGVLRDRLRSHFIQGSHSIPGAAFYRVEKTGSKLRAEQRERALLKDFAAAHNGELPRYNKRIG